MSAASKSQSTAGFLRGPSRAVTPLSLWGGDTLVYKSVIALTAIALPLIALANWLAHGTAWGPQLLMAAVLGAVALVCYALSRRGMEDTAAALLIGAIWTAATIFAFATQFGLHSSVIYLYLPCMLYSVLFFGVTIASAELALTLAALLLMYWAEERGSIGGLRAFAENSSNLSFLIGVVVTCIGTFFVGVAYHRRVASETSRVIAEAEQRRVAMEQAQLAQAQLETANAKLNALNAKLAEHSRLHELATVRARRDFDLAHEVLAKDVPQSLARLRAALDAPDEQTEARLRREFARIETVVAALGQIGGDSEPGLRLEPVDLSTLAHANVRELRTRPRYARIVFDIDGGLRAMADKAQVAALLHHLIKRAASACDAEPEPVVHVGSGSLEGRALFFVRDNGPGMDDAQRARLFRPFGRENMEDTVDVGIVSARRIAERHGGELDIESTPGKGTTFFFTLAAAPAG